MSWSSDQQLIHDKPEMYISGYIHDDGSYNLNVWMTSSGYYQYEFKVRINGTVILTRNSVSGDGNNSLTPGYKYNMQGTVSEKYANVDYYCGDPNCGSDAHNWKSIISTTLYVAPSWGTLVADSTTTTITVTPTWNDKNNNNGTTDADALIYLYDSNKNKIAQGVCKSRDGSIPYTFTGLDPYKTYYYKGLLYDDGKDDTNPSPSKTYDTSMYSISTKVPYIYIYVNNTWKKAVPYVFNGTSWKISLAYVSDGSSYKPCYGDS